MSSTTPVDLLVLAAHPPELRGFRPELGDSLTGTIEGLHVVTKTVGVGMGVAGGSAAKRIFQLEPRAVVLVGTCGVYPGIPDYRPYDIILGSKFQLVDQAEIAGLASFPDPMQTELPANAPLTAGLAAHAPRGRVVPLGSPLAPTRDDAMAAAVPQRTGCHAETLEAFSIAHACLLGQVPFAAVLGVTHVAGSTAMTDFRQFERQASIAAAEVILRWLHHGAQGLPHRAYRDERFR